MRVRTRCRPYGSLRDMRCTFIPPSSHLSRQVFRMEPHNQGRQCYHFIRLVQNRSILRLSLLQPASLRGSEAAAILISAITKRAPVGNTYYALSTLSTSIRQLKVKIHTPRLRSAQSSRRSLSSRFGDVLHTFSIRTRVSMFERSADFEFMYFFFHN